MKTLACVCLLVTSGVTNAGTIKLPLPMLAQIAPNIPATCTWPQYEHPHTIVTGFDATGNYVLASADDVAICGHSGRGSNLHYYPYCASFVWDLSGNLVQTTIGVCQKASPSARYTNAGGYTAATFVQLYYGYLQYEYPLLDTP